MIVSYSIGDDGMVDALIKDAVTRGLDVEIWGGGAAVERAREVAALGARVWLPRPGKFIHAKAVVADGLVAVVGSANLAQTSMTRNMEAGVVSTKDVPRWSAEWRRELSMMSRPI
jgi:phosphatidylserine/phosphatidylglycerophosphate/cardiolipin synthase-like enzyme